MNEVILKQALKLINDKIKIEVRYIGGRYYMQYYDDYYTPIQVLITEAEAQVLQNAIKNVS